MNAGPFARIARHRGAHLRVLGPPASGKTSALVERFVSLDAGGRHPVVIAFSRAQRERMLDRLMPRHSARAARFPVYTYHEVVLEIIARARPGTRRPLSDVEERIALARVLSEGSGELESDYRSISESQGFARSLLSVFHTLEQNGVGADDALEARSGPRVGARARDVLSLFARYERFLEERGFSTYYDAAWRAARALAHDPSTDPLGRCSDVLIDDFQDVDAGQFALVQALAPPGGSRSVAVFGDPTGARFGFRGTSDRVLLAAFPDAYHPDDLHCGSHPGDDLPLFRGAAPEFPPHLTLDVAEDEVAEAQHVAAAVARALEEGTVEPSEVAVVARDRSRYELVVALAMRERGVPFDTGNAGRYALEGFAGAFLALMGERFGESRVDAILASPFYDALRGCYAERLELRERRPERDTAELRRLAGFIRQTCVDGKTGSFQMTRFLEAVVVPVVAPAAARVSEAAVASVAGMVDEWGAYEEMVRHVGGRARVEEFLYHFRSAPAVSTERDPRCVAFYTAHEVVSRSFPIVFVVGCSEGVFPAVDAREGYMPYATLSELFAGRRLEFHEARDRRARLRDEHALLVTALTRGYREVHASAPRKICGEPVSAPARALEPYADGGAADVARRTSPPLGAVAAIALAPMRSEPPPAGTLGPTVRAWLSARPAAGAFAIERFALSPSRLSRYIECQRRFFYGRVLGIEEEKSIHLTIGSVFHEVMEKIGQALPSRDDLAAGLTSERIQEFVDEALGQTRDLGPQGSLVESLSRHYLAEMVGGVRAIEKERRDRGLAVEVEVEGRFERDGWPFVGKIDRVDSAGGRPRVVIDYKTGKGIHKKGETIREYLLAEKGSGGDYLQVPMYSYGAAHGERYPDLFCYYVVQPGEVPYVAGLYISEDPNRHESAGDFESAPRKHPFATVSPADVDRVMDFVVERAAEIFAERDGFPRTDDVTLCRGCYFNRLCDRRES